LELKRFINAQTWGSRRTLPEFAPKSFSQIWKETDL